MAKYAGNNWSLASGALTTSGDTTALAMPAVGAGGPSDALEGGGWDFPQAQAATVIVANPISSGQTITAASLSFSTTLGGIVGTVSYALSAVSIDPGAAQTFYVTLTSGVLPTPALSVTFGSTPTAGTLTASLTLSGGGAAGNVGSGVSSFNSRTGAVNLTSGDVTGALGFTPVTNARTVTAGTGLTGGGALTANRTFALANTAVAPGSYTNSSITVDAQGRLTAASSGSGGGGGGGPSWFVVSG